MYYICIILHTPEPLCPAIESNSSEKLLLEHQLRKAVTRRKFYLTKRATSPKEGLLFPPPIQFLWREGVRATGEAHTDVDH